jgi:hypothetical protein
VRLTLASCSENRDTLIDSRRENSSMSINMGSVVGKKRTRFKLDKLNNGLLGH